MLFAQKSMRKELAEMENVRAVFTGVFVRFGENGSPRSFEWVQLTQKSSQ